MRFENESAVSLLLLSLWLYARQPGRVLKELNAQQSENFWIFFEIPFCNRLKVFYLHLESPSDQENRNGFAVERLWFLGHRVESTPFRPFEKFCE